MRRRAGRDGGALSRTPVHDQTSSLGPNGNATKKAALAKLSTLDHLSKSAAEERRNNAILPPNTS